MKVASNATYFLLFTAFADIDGITFNKTQQQPGEGAKTNDFAPSIKTPVKLIE